LLQFSQLFLLFIFTLFTLDNKLPLFFWHFEHFAFMRKKWRTPDGGRCYPLYQRGPCGAGYQLRFSRARQAPVCEPALCEDGSVFIPDDGDCHPLEEPGGPCKDDLHVLTLDAGSLEPVCRLDESRVKRLFDVIPPGVITDAPLSSELVAPQDCRLDARGRCVRSFGGGKLRSNGSSETQARGYLSWLESFRSRPLDGGGRAAVSERRNKNS